MPYTINGIGTTYWGKQKLEVQQGVCEFCGRASTLSSYETRLWFSIVFVPVIPLARRQILDYCASCTGHRALPVDQWRAVQADAIGSAIAQVEANPESPEHAIACHATLAACGKQEEAGQYAEAMLGRFGDNADVQMHLGGWFEQIGQPDRADRCFARALEIDPQHPGALRAAAVGLLQQKRPRDAEAQLKSHQPPSPHFDPSLFFALAQAYQAEGDHESAARLLRLIAGAAPGVAEDKTFRKAAQQSEAALGQHGSVLPSLPWYKRRGVMWPAVAAVVLLVLVVFDRYFAQNRELFVVNGLPRPLKVRLDAGNPVDVPVQGLLRLSIAEGAHTFSIVEPASLAREEPFTIASGVVARWLGKQVSVVDPARSAVVIWEESIYAANAHDQGGDYRLHAARPFSRFDDIDYKFEEFPHQIQVKNSAKRVTKRRVGLAPLSPLELLLGAPDALAGEPRLDYLEAHLLSGENRLPLLRYYWQAVVNQQQVARCRAYLKKSLDERPVDVEWHRAYQSAAELIGEHPLLVTEYDALLKAEPENADLLYLRGRIEPFGADSEPFFAAALAADSTHSYTWSANCYRLSSAGNFEEALEAIDKAVRSEEERGDLTEIRRRVLQSLGRHEQVVRELRAQMKSEERLPIAAYRDLIDALAIQGDVAEANRTLAEFRELIEREWPQDPVQLQLNSRLTVLLAAKKYAELRADASALRDPVERSVWSFTANLCDARPQEAESDVAALPPSLGGIQHLCLSIAWRNLRRQQEADQWLVRAIEKLSRGTTEERIVAGWLHDPPADRAALMPQIADIALSPDDKAIVLLALTGPSADGSEELRALAERLNAWPSGRRAFVEASLAAIR